MKPPDPPFVTHPTAASVSSPFLSEQGKESTFRGFVDVIGHAADPVSRVRGTPDIRCADTQMHILKQKIAPRTDALAVEI